MNYHGKTALTISPLPKSLVRPTLYLVTAIFVLRVVDVFFLRSDEWFGEQIVTKLGGLILVAIFLVRAELKWAQIGFVRPGILRAIVIGIAIMASGLAFGYLVEWLVLVFSGSDPVLILSSRPPSLTPAETSKTAPSTILLGGNVVNAFMEEAVFRGLLLLALLAITSAGKANFWQAVLFGLWHVVWPVRSYFDGLMDAQTAIIMAVGYAIVSGLIGYAWGAMLLWLGNIWAAWAAHLLNNSIYNLLHIALADGSDPGSYTIKVLVSVLVVFVAMLVIARFRNRV